jgi:hypothetical protein
LASDTNYAIPQEGRTSDSGPAAQNAAVTAKFFYNAVRRRRSMETRIASEQDRHLLRHALATLAYRGGKVLRGPSDEFSGFRPAETSRSAGQILAHISDLLDWALSIAEGKPVWQTAPPQSWTEDSRRFFTALGALDARLGSDQPLGASEERLFQGPVADALTHVGQIAILRRMAGKPVRSENYFLAEIAVGRVGAEQTPPRREFD